MKTLLSAIVFIALAIGTGAMAGDQTAEKVDAMLGNPFDSGFDGRCPVCIEKGVKSKVYAGMTTCTAMATFSYYDEDGNYVFSDPNSCSTTYECSNGHKFSVTSCQGKSSVMWLKDEISKPSTLR